MSVKPSNVDKVLREKLVTVSIDPTAAKVAEVQSFIDLNNAYQVTEVSFMADSAYVAAQDVPVDLGISGSTASATHFWTGVGMGSDAKSAWEVVDASSSLVNAKLPAGHRLVIDQPANAGQTATEIIMQIRLTPYDHVYGGQSKRPSQADAAS